MLGLRRDALEFIVIGLSSARIAYSLWIAAGLSESYKAANCPTRTSCTTSEQQTAGAGWELIGLVCTTVAAVWQEVLSTQHHSGV